MARMTQDETRRLEALGQQLRALFRALEDRPVPARLIDAIGDHDAEAAPRVKGGQARRSSPSYRGS